MTCTDANCPRAECKIAHLEARVKCLESLNRILSERVATQKEILERRAERQEPPCPK